MKVKTWVFNFHPGFADDVGCGNKVHTIRAERKDKRRPVLGDNVNLYTGLRSKKARLLMRGKVIRVRRVRMLLSSGKVYYGGTRLRDIELTTLAKIDGFDSAADMLNWFRKRHGDGDFVGFAVAWRPVEAC